MRNISDCIKVGDLIGVCRDRKIVFGVFKKQGCNSVQFYQFYDYYAQRRKVLLSADYIVNRTHYRVVKVTKDCLSERELSIYNKIVRLMKEEGIIPTEDKNIKQKRKIEEKLKVIELLDFNKK